MTEIDQDKVRAKFDEFLESNYSDEIEQLEEEYPSRYSLEVSLSELERFDQRLGYNYTINPNRLQPIFDRSLQYHDAHDAACLMNAYVVPVGDEGKEPREIRHDQNTIVTVYARVSETDEPETLLKDAVFICRDCGGRTIEEQTGDELREPYECSKCGKKRVEYDVVVEDSTTRSLQHFAIEDPWSLTAGGGILTMECEAHGEYTGKFSPGDWVKMTGQVKYQLVDNTRNVEPYLEVYHITHVDAETALDIPEDVPPKQPEKTLLSSPTNSLTSSHLKGYADHVDIVLEKIEARKMNEDTGKLKLVTPFLEVLGWDIYGAQVRMEYGVYTGDVDYAAVVDDDPIFMVEAKSPGNLQPGHFDQLKQYMQSGQTGKGILTDGIQFKFVANDESYVRPTVVVDTTYDILHEFIEEIANFTPDAVSERI